jgi:hypothetical protein
LKVYPAWRLPWLPSVFLPKHQMLREASVTQVPNTEVG